jgi:hypothetical protein
MGEKCYDIHGEIELTNWNTTTLLPMKPLHQAGGEK